MKDAAVHYRIKHALPGRLRVSVSPWLFGKDALPPLNARLLSSTGVIRVQANRLSHSLTIFYNPALTGKMQILEALNGIAQEISKRPAEQAPIPNPASRAVAVHHQQSRGRKRGFKFAWKVAGTFFLGVGTLGAFLPLLPTVPLYLLAAFCYFRGSPGLYRRLLQNRTIGRLLQNYHSGKGLPARTKLKAILFMWLGLGVSMVFLASGLTLRLVLFGVGIGVTLHILRIKTYQFAATEHHLSHSEKV